MTASPTPSPAPAEGETGSVRPADRSEEEFLAEYTRLVPELVIWAKLRMRSGMALPLDESDFAQEVWLRVLEHRREFDPSRGSFGDWVFGFAKRVWLEVANPTRRLGRRVAHAGQSTLAAQAKSVTSASQAAMRSELQRNLSAFLDEQDPVDRQVYMLHWLERLPCARVGELLELSPEAVSKRWQRLQLRIRESGFGRAFERDHG